MICRRTRPIAVAVAIGFTWKRLAPAPAKHRPSLGDRFETVIACSVVKAGTYIGDEGAVGCAMLHHVHFEVVVPASGRAIDDGGFLLDNADAKRERNPGFCGVPGNLRQREKSYRSQPCGQGAEP